MRPDLDVAPDRKLTQPLGGAVSFILTFAVGLLVVALLLIPLNHGFSLFGFGSGPACANVSLNGLSQNSTGSVLAHMKPGTFSSPSELNLCANQPTLTQRTLVTLTQAPATVLYLTVLVLLWQLLRTIGKTGPFVPLVARRLRFLAWFILAGSMVVAAGEGLAQNVFASTVVADRVPIAANVINNVMDGLVLPVLIACGLLTLARVIRVGARMSDDLAGTI